MLSGQVNTGPVLVILFAVFVLHSQNTESTVDKTVGDLRLGELWWASMFSRIGFLAKHRYGVMYH